MDLNLFEQYNEHSKKLAHDKRVKIACIVINMFLILAMFFYIIGCSRSYSAQTKLNYDSSNVTIRAVDKESYMDDEGEIKTYVTIINVNVFTKSPKGLSSITCDIRIYGKYNEILFSDSFTAKDLNMKENEEITVRLNFTTQSPTEKRLKLHNADFDDINCELKIRKIVFGDGHITNVY